ncbi:MAG: biotin carboxylase N-terminal domain-containing protein, partial [Pseudomonadota bacterium]
MRRDFDSVLVANRGEIACRILRTVRDAGLRGIAIYSQADRTSPHVSMVEDALCIGPGPATDSYLSIDRVIEAARQSRAGAIHPGYGFLSENADFAQAVIDAGIVWIGPSPASIRLMGQKAAAKGHVERVGVPCLPGYHGTDQSPETLRAEANAIGYPIMVKASAGGGGRGMRLALDETGLDSAIESARSEAERAFGSIDLILER